MIRKGKNISYRGVQIDMDAMRRENENSTAIGNMGVNARGDKIKGNDVVLTADDFARMNHRNPVSVKTTGLKGEMPKETPFEDKTKSTKNTKTPPKKEKETPDGDIIIE